MAELENKPNKAAQETADLSKLNLFDRTLLDGVARDSLTGSEAALAEIKAGEEYARKHGLGAKDHYDETIQRSEPIVDAAGDMVDWNKGKSNDNSLLVEPNPYYSHLDQLESSNGRRIREVAEKAMNIERNAVVDTTGIPLAGTVAKTALQLAVEAAGGERVASALNNVDLSIEADGGVKATYSVRF